MKKSLVLAMAMALGVTASAYAANPFSDVPAGHWAYDSIDKLAAAGVVDGMGDGSYQGDRTMTRYEMAQIVAKAMAKGCNVDKLAAEFADELDALGVRVAALEKKADNVKISGQFRAKYVSQHAYDNGDSYQADFRSRIWIKGQVNDDWAVTAMLQNTEDLTGAAKAVNEENDVAFQRAYVEGKLGGLAFVGGRYDTTLADGAIYDTRLDGVEVNYGSKIKVRGMFGKMTDGLTMPGDPMGGNYAALEAQGDIAKGLTLKSRITTKEHKVNVIVRGAFSSYNKEAGQYSYHKINVDRQEQEAFTSRWDIRKEEWARVVSRECNRIFNVKKLNLERPRLSKF